MRILFFFFIAIVASACSSIEVLDASSGEGFKLSNYKTFDFYKLRASGDTTTNFAANAEILKQSIAGHLAQKGLTHATDNPDLLVNIGIVILDKLATRQTSIQDAPKYVGTRNYSWHSQEVEVGRYKTGTVTVHLVDPRTNKLMWKGVVEGVLPEKNSKLPATIEEGMTALFAKLQPD